jgi:hypothetical protein
MQSEKHTEGQPCLKTLLAAELFSDLTEEDQEMSYLDAQILRLLHQLTPAQQNVFTDLVESLLLAQQSEQPSDRE